MVPNLISAQKYFFIPESVFVNHDTVRRDKLLSILVPEYPPYPRMGLDQALHDHLSALANVGRVNPIVDLHVDNGQVINVEHS